MAASSRERIEAARRLESDAALTVRAQAAPRAPRLSLHRRFDVIAELKFTSPAAGALAKPSENWLHRVEQYAAAGAAAVSVLTEPSRFDGSLDHLRLAATALREYGVPAMRKDFIIDRYQIDEARAAGAGGVLLIVRMLDHAQLEHLLEYSRAQELFVLLEAFDAHDLDSARRALDALKLSRNEVLVGLNCRDLQTLQVDTANFERLATHMPEGWAKVAESGVSSAHDAKKMRELGFDAALVGSALMESATPQALLSKMLAAGRAS